jgi:hypothetical protein
MILMRGAPVLIGFRILLRTYESGHVRSQIVLLHRLRRMNSV